MPMAGELMPGSHHFKNVFFDKQQAKSKPKPLIADLKNRKFKDFW